MRQGILGLGLFLISVFGILALNTLYIVDQTQQAVITQFGETMGSSIETPGLHFKMPWYTVTKFDKRILEWDGYPSEVPTKDKKFIWVDVTGRWKITDPLKFLQTMHNERNAQSRLDDIMDGITRNFITRHELVEVVRSTNRILTSIQDTNNVVGAEATYEKIDQGRDVITRKILEAAREVIKNYGIDLIDLRIKRINYVQSVQQKVFERMISERQRAAEQLRSEGQGIRAEVRGRTDKELKKITSEAYRQVQGIRGKADAEATQIYADAYSKDPDFYSFLSTLETYPEALKGSRTIFSTDSAYLKYLKKTE
jgi:membrane protease subunit HflC